MRAVDVSRSRYVSGQMLQPWHPFTSNAKQTVTSGQPLLMQVEIFPTSAMIPAGHQLQIAVSASNLPAGMAPLPNTVNGLAGLLTIYSDAHHPSSVVLPHVPSSALH
jgi:predicted acyl esterase